MECGDGESEKVSPVINSEKNKTAKTADTGKDFSANSNKKSNSTNRFSALARTPPPSKPLVKDGAAG